MTAAPAPSTILYYGRTCLCIRAEWGAYAIVTRANGRLVGTVRWHTRQACWTFLPVPGTSWTSGGLADIGLWLRRLARTTPPSATPLEPACADSS